MVMAPIPKLLSEGAKDKEGNLKKVVVHIPLPPTAGMRDIKCQTPERAPQYQHWLSGGYGPYGPVPVGHRHTPRYRTRELDNGCAIM